MRSFVIKTNFDLFNIVWKVFPILYTVCIKFIKAKVLNLLKLGENWRCRNGLDRLLHDDEFVSRQRFSL